MIPKFRAYDGGSLCRMYSPEEVMVGNGDIWIIDEDGVAGEWIVNNDLVLMQSTGLFDKNGKEIFEGDILSVEIDEEKVRVSVFWNDKYALFMFESEKYNETEVLAELFEDNSYSLEIIGNIYENPELLEVSS